MPEKTALSFCRRGQGRVHGHRRQRRHDDIDHSNDDRFEEGLFGVEVVVEGALGRPELVQDVLDAQLLISLGLDQALGGVDEAVTPDRMRLWIEDPRQLSLPNNRPTVGLIIPHPSIGAQMSR